MFTGLIEAIGTVTGVSPSPAGHRLVIATTLAGELSAGDSLAVNGVCLTVVSRDDHSVSLDVSPQTARVTTLGTIKPGQRLNLERSLSAGARLGGHFVQGHVDEIGALVSIEQQGESWWLTFSYPPELASCIVPRGSIAVDGISLTVATLQGSTFSVQIIPFTWDHTTLHTLQQGAGVNLETDILGKYVVRALEASRSAALSQTRGT